MKYIYTILFFCLFISWADAQNNMVVATFKHKANSEDLILNKTVFPIWNGKKVILSRAEFYISEIEFKKEDDAAMPLPDTYILVNAGKPGVEYKLGEYPMQAAKKMILHFGVPASVNHLDPATYFSGHPLAFQDPSMHWGWTSGYRFIALEGMIDNDNDGIPETVFEIHSLGDALYTKAEVEGYLSAKDGNLHVDMTLDYAQLFKDIAMKGNLIQHGSSSLNAKVLSNAALAKFIQLPQSVSTKDVVENSSLISCLPNPAQDHLNVFYTLPGEQTMNLLLSNSLGVAVMNMNNLPAKGNVSLSTEGLAEGVYFISFFEKGRLVARNKILISK